MDITSKPNLKPLRSYDEHDVIEFFSHTLSEANKGSLVAVTAAEGNTNVWQNANATPPPSLDSFGQLAGVPSRAYADRKEVTWKVKNATTGDIPLGLLLYDVRETNSFGEKYIYRPRYERVEQDAVISGEAVPIVTRGVFKINGFVGTPGPGSGGATSASGGYIAVAEYGATGVTTVGKFLTSADADGYAVFKLEL